MFREPGSQIMAKSGVKLDVPDLRNAPALAVLETGAFGVKSGSSCKAFLSIDRLCQALLLGGIWNIRSR